MSASVRTCGVMSVITACIPSKLACGKLRRQLRDGGLHQVGQRLRPDADQQHACREYAEHDPFAHVDVLQLRHVGVADVAPDRSEEHTSELQSLMRISYAVFCLKK